MNSFTARVYEMVAKIPRGKVATYGQLAVLLGCPRAARAVGTAISKTPEHLGLSCHRVINSKGEMVPGNVFGGPDRQRRLLMDEGVCFLEDGRVDLKKSIWVSAFKD